MTSEFLTQKLSKTANLINTRIAELLPESSQSKLVEAARYSALSKGKKIRPFLTLTVADIFDFDAKIALDAACALELVHIYSLIHDDLPAMDDDDFRRGEPTCHKKFNEATAILAGDALLTYAFEIISELNISAEIRCQLINLLTKAIGFSGMVGGQMLDLEAGNQTLSKEQIFHLHHLKTGKMIIAAVEIATVLAGVNNEHKQALVNYAIDIGLAFQIKDDILDCEEQKTQTISKPDVVSIVNLIGFEEADLQLKKLESSAINHLTIFDKTSDNIVLLKDFAEFIVKRNS